MMDLERDESLGEDYYSVNTITPRSNKQYTESMKKALSFDGRRTPPTESSSGATGAPVETTAGISGVLVPGKESAFGTISITDAQEFVNRFTYADEKSRRMIVDHVFQEDESKIENPIDSSKITGAYIPAEQGKAIIELYKNANYSTLPHEMMHQYAPRERG